MVLELKMGLTQRRQVAKWNARHCVTRLATAILVFGGAAYGDGDGPADGQRVHSHTFQEVNDLPVSPATARIPYGDDPLQFGDLRVPEGAGPFPVAIVAHGGCWLAKYADLKYTSPMADALTKRGIATWNIEYRRADQPGGGWPGTFIDVARAADHLRKISEKHSLDLTRVITVGHSAGGHLATWLAARPRLKPDAELYLAEPLPIRGVVNLAGICDLAAFASDNEQDCGFGVLKLMDGKESQHPARYAQASPIKLLPLGVPQVMIHGALDKPVPPKFARAYEAAARMAGDDVRYIELPAAGHFDVVAPTAPAWKTVEEAVMGFARPQPTSKP